MAIVKSARRGMGVDAWLNKDDGDGGSGGAKFLSINFKDGKKKYLVWIHPDSGPDIVWRSVVKNSDGKKMRIFRWNTMEDENILRKLRFLKEDGSFEHSLTTDPVLLLVQWVNQKIASGEINFTDEIFSWEPEEGDGEVVHAGGFTGLFNSKKLTEAQRKEMRKVGVRQDEAFMEDVRPQEETVFIMVDNDAPGEGPQVVTLKKGLAKALKTAIETRKLQFSTNPDAADPWKHPVCWALMKDDSVKDAPPRFLVAATDHPLTDEIQAALEEDAPDTSKMLDPTNVIMLRNAFESAWCHDIVPDWDEIFEAALAAVKGTRAAEDPTSFNYGKNKKKEEVADDDDEEETPAPEKKEEAKGDESSEDEETEEVLKCDKCGGDLDQEEFEKDLTCPHCGAEYEKTGDGEYNLKPEKPKKPEIKASRRPRT